MPRSEDGQSPRRGQAASAGGKGKKTAIPETWTGSEDSPAATAQVRAALRGPVMQTLAEGIPEVRNMPGIVAYDKVMGDIALLEQCFAYFRASRDKFTAILVDAQQRQVNDDSAKLSCDRTLNEVVAMIVRSAAFRYFGKRLGDVRPLRTVPQKKPGLLAKAVAALTGAKPPPLQPPRSKADQLYDAIREYLLYEWQVPLVPAYSQLTPGEVTRLGPRLVELRSEGELLSATGRPRLGPQIKSPGATTLDWVVTPPPAAAPPPPQKPPESAPLNLDDVLTPDRARLRVEALGATLLDKDVRDAAGNVEQMVALTSVLKQVGSGLVRALVVDLGLNKKQMTVCLLTAQKLLPPSAFEQLARSSENAAVMMRFMVAAKKAGIGSPSSLGDCAAFIATAFAAAKPVGEGGTQ